MSFQEQLIKPRSNMEEFKQTEYQKKIDRANKRWAQGSGKKISRKKQNLPSFAREFRIQKAVRMHKLDDDEVDYAED